jgi:hypothetical protein
MFEIGFWDSLKILYQLQGPDDFFLNLWPLFLEKLLEIGLVKNDLSILHM